MQQTRNAQPPAGMLTIQEVAKRDKVGTAVISRLAARLIERYALPVTRDARGRVQALDILEYDRLRGLVANPSKRQRPPPRRPSRALTDPESYDRALVRKTLVQAQRAELKLAEERGELVRKSELVDAIAICCASIIRILQHDIAMADDLALIGQKEGANGIRRFLRASVDRRRTEIADEMARLSGDGPAADG
jgi:hypothetical protein